MTEVLRITRRRNSHILTTIVLMSDPSFDLRVPNRMAVVAEGVAKHSTRSVFLQPKVDGFRLGSIHLHNLGIYEFASGTTLTLGDVTWLFEFINPAHATRRVLARHSSPTEDDDSVLLPRQGDPDSPGVLLRRCLQRTCTDFPLWLPVHGGSVTSHPSDDMLEFFQVARSPSSCDTEIAVSFPFGTAADFLATLQTLPENVNHLHLKISTFQQSKLVKSCLLAGSRATNITTMSLEYLANEEDVLVTEDTTYHDGNLQTLSFMNLRDPMCLKWVLATLNMNLGLRELRLGGHPTLVVGALLGTRSRIHYKALELDMREFENPEDALNVLVPPHHYLEELKLVFQVMPPISLIHDVFERFSSSLIKVHVSILEPTAHFQCGNMCSNRFFPENMPALKTVALSDLVCSGSATAQALKLGSVIDLSVQVNVEDDSSVRLHFKPDLASPERLSVRTLYLAPSFVSKDLVFSANSWDNLTTVTVDLMQLMDIPHALKLARNAITLLLILSPPAVQLRAQEDPMEDFESTIADALFVGNEDEGTTLRDCTRLKHLKVIFGVREGSAWDRPTLGESFYWNGLHHLENLRRFEANEISTGLMDCLHMKRRFDPNFSFEATLYSEINPPPTSTS